MFAKLDMCHLLLAIVVIAQYIAAVVTRIAHAREVDRMTKKLMARSLYEYSEASFAEGRSNEPTAEEAAAILQRAEDIHTIPLR